jgi:ammonium transporter, Amt family
MKSTTKIKSASAFFALVSMWLIAACLSATSLMANAQSTPTQINFESGKSGLPAGSKVAIDAAATLLKGKADSVLTVSGFTDKTGDAATNAELAKQRAFAVRDALKAAGVADDKIVLQKPDAVMVAGSPEEARRVEIKLAPAVAAPAVVAAATAPVMTAVAPAPAAAAAPAAPVPNKGDVAWLLIATALVIMMSVPGLALFYGGMVRSKNMLSVLMQVFVVFSLIIVLWVIYGYSFAFTEGNAFVGGGSRMFFKDMFDPVKGEFAMAATFSKATVVPEIVFAAFQASFAAITCCLILGAFAERAKFSAVLVFIIAWFTFSYIPVAHMVWFWMGPDAYTGPTVVEAMNAKAGYLWNMGALDFAGGTVVHINAGVAGLVAAAMIGKRIGWGREAMTPHNLPMTMIGASLLWVGWFGFNAGSALEANGTAGLAFMNTLLAAAAAVLSWISLEWILKGKPSMLGAASGAIAGLVAVTPAAGNVGIIGALVIGVVAGVICLWGVTGLKRMLKVDDSLDVFGVHAVGGIVGALLTGVFNDPSLGGPGFVTDWVTAKTGFTSIGTQVLVQAKAVGLVVVWSAVVTAVSLFVIKLVMGLRVSEEDEREGLDVTSHGEKAYN